VPVLRALALWGTDWTVGPAGTAPMQMLHGGCGGSVDVAGTCDHCGRPVRRDEEAWLRPWRSPEPVPLAAAVGATHRLTAG
jgi:hypothetical protein